MNIVFGRVRLLGFGLLGITFLAGALAGAAVDRVVGDETPPAEARQDRRDNEGRDRSYLIDRVEMSDAQRASIDSILELRAQRMRAVWREVEPQLDAISDSARAEIMAVLTPEQQAEYDEMRERRRRDRNDGPDGNRGTQDQQEADGDTAKKGG
jgi:hypothetical protein